MVKKTSKVFLIFSLPLPCSANRGVKSFCASFHETRGGTGIFNIGSWSDGGPGNKSVMGFHRRQSLVIVCFRHQPPRQEVRLEIENDLVHLDFIVHVEQ